MVYSLGRFLWRITLLFIIIPSKSMAHPMLLLPQLHLLTRYATNTWDSFICALGDGHHGVRIPIIRNEHLANFINTLNSIKVKIGMYTIVTGLKSDWLQYANHNTIYQELSLAPDKKTIIPTIESFLNDKWFKSWDDLAGHAQTKYWLPRTRFFSCK